MKRHLPRRLTVAVIVLLATGLLTACGGEDHDDGGSHDGGSHDGGAAPATSVPSHAAFNAADVTFATEMIPHHQQALEMAQIAATRATDPQVKDLAARVRAAQDPEVATLSGWLREWNHPVPTSSPGMGHGQHAGDPGMMSDQEMKDLMDASGTDFDRMFLRMMIRHHEGAIETATREQQQGQYAGARKLAEKIAADQTAEVTEIEGLLGKL